MDKAARPPAADAATAGAAHMLCCRPFCHEVCLHALRNEHLVAQVLVTGSLYLVGDVLRLLGKAPA